MDSRTVVAWIQLAVGAFLIGRAVSYRRAGRGIWKFSVIPGLLSTALGVQMLTTGWVRAAAWVVMGVGGVFALAGMFQARDRFGLWSNIVFCAFSLPIALIELRFDDLSAWQWALFAGFGVVLVTLLAVTIVRLTRSYKRVALPSA
ncbi:MAG TPA: hypothetical protein VJN96_00325 [Vicinamibacterales bacterium]|nr:hypothetical protein [Vicinamibacterales bacterium]